MLEPPLRLQSFGLSVPRARAILTSSHPATTMPANSEIVNQFIEEVLNQGNINACGKYFWEDMVEQEPLPSQGPGLDGLKDVLRGLRSAFPDMHWTIEEQISEGEKVMTRFEWTATHQGAFFGIAATGRPVKVWGMVVDRLVNGKIKDTRILMDTPAMMAQLTAPEAEL